MKRSASNPQLIGPARVNNTQVNAMSVLGKVQLPNGLAHHGLGIVNPDRVRAALRRIAVARPLRQVVEVLSGGGLVDLELDQASPVRCKYYVEQPRSVWTDLKH